MITVKINNYEIVSKFNWMKRIHRLVISKLIHFTFRENYERK